MPKRRTYQETRTRCNAEKSTQCSAETNTRCSVETSIRCNAENRTLISLSRLIIALLSLFLTVIFSDGLIASLSPLDARTNSKMKYSILNPNFADALVGCNLISIEFHVHLLLMFQFNRWETEKIQHKWYEKYEKQWSAWKNVASRLPSKRPYSSVVRSLERLRQPRSATAPGPCTSRHISWVCGWTKKEYSNRISAPKNAGTLPSPKSVLHHKYQACCEARPNMSKNKWERSRCATFWSKRWAIAIVLAPHERKKTFHSGKRDMPLTNKLRV